MALSTFSMTILLYCYFFDWIYLVALRFMPPFSYTINNYSLFSMFRWRWASSYSYFLYVIPISFFSYTIYSGSTFERWVSWMFYKTICFSFRISSGCLMAAKVGILPFPIFLKSSNITFFPSLLTMRTIYSTSSWVWGWSMHLRKKEISFVVMAPSLLISMALKASLMASSENSSRLMS